MKHEKYLLNPRQEKVYNRAKAFLDGQKDLVLEKLKRIIVAFGYSNKLKLQDEGKFVTMLEFFYTPDDFSLSLIPRTEVYPDYAVPFEIAYIFENHNGELDYLGGYLNAMYGNEYPEDEPFLDLYEDNRCEMLSKMLHHLVTSWFAYNWQEAGGNECGTFAATVQNNSVDTFDLRTCKWDESTPFPVDPNEEIFPFFPRRLSKFEIEQRVNSRMSMLSTNYFRYFEKGTEFIEFGLYRNFLGTRNGIKGEVKDFEILEYLSREEAISQLLQNCDESLLNGYEELPSNSIKIFEYALDIGEMEITRSLSKINKTDIEKFEDIINVQLPIDYKYFLMLNNGGFVTSNDQNFPISNTSWRRIKNFFGIDYINNELSINKYFDLLKNELKDEYLAIANDRNEDFICLGLQESNYGKLYLFVKDKNIKIEIAQNLLEFLNGFFDDHFVEDEVTRMAKRNNIPYFEDLLEKGWNINSKLKEDKPALFHALRKKNIEIIDFLLKNGAQIKKFRNWSFEKDEDIIRVFESHGIKIGKSDQGDNMFTFLEN